MKKKLILLTLLLCSSVLAWAQNENQNWYFGSAVGLSFKTGQPAVLPASAMRTYEACASISDGSGKLLFYTNSVNIWNSAHQIMLNAEALGGHESASQGAIILPLPGSTTQYYVFVVDGCDNNLQGGLKYSVVDMSQEGGLGAVTRHAIQVSDTPLTEKLTIVRHANGTDNWVLVHGWKSDAFYAYLINSSGIATLPIKSTVGSVHTGGGGDLRNANGVGYMKASANGKKLALGIRDAGFELFDFNDATGEVSNGISLPSPYRSYGVEFSPDGSRLYGSDLDGYRVFQFNLLAGSADAIAESRVDVGTTSGYAGALQMAPDGKIYVAQHNSLYLSAIATPNGLGYDCTFQQDVLYLGGNLCQTGLPNQPNKTSTVLTKTTAARNETLAVYPNPARTQATITLPENMRHKACTVRLFNTLGQQVYEYTLPASQSTETQVTVPVGNLGAGIYKMHLSNAVGVITGNLLVE